MGLDWQRFYHACNPVKTLAVENEEDRKYYIDFSSVRGGKIIQELERTITHLSTDRPTCQLFTGHIGCGKSTELLRLKAELGEQGWHVVYFESSQFLDLADVDITDILMAIAQRVSNSLEKLNIKLKPGFFINLFQEIGDFLQTPIEMSAAELSLGIGKITTKTKDSPNLRHQLRQYLEPRTSSILEAINEELLDKATLELKRMGKQGLVVIVDNLDRIDNRRMASGRTLPEYLFIDRGEQLNSLNCHVVYTLPLSLLFCNESEVLKHRLGGGLEPKILPMIAAKLPDGSKCEEGIYLLKQMILARAFPDLPPKERLQLVGALFDRPETLERLCQISGGHVRNLLGFLYRCLQKQEPPILKTSLETTIKERCNDLSLSITPDDWELLRQVAKSQTVRGEEEYQSLLRSMFVFEYRNEDGSWFAINPVLAEARELQ